MAIAFAIATSMIERLCILAIQSSREKPYTDISWHYYVFGF
jgi:hypothetical protein